MINDALAIGADIGGTHITAGLVDLEKKIILPGTIVRTKVDSHASSEDIIKIWAGAIIDAGKEHQVNKVSLAIPGPFDYEHGICLIKNQDKYENLYGLNIKNLLSEKLQHQPEEIILINDAASFLQGEVFGGAANGFEKVIGLTLGTGLGTCIYENESASDANLWNLPFKTGIAEDYLSTRWFTNRYLEISGKKITGVRELSGLMENDPNVKLIFDEFSHNLASFLIEFIAISPTQAIVIGGNIAKSFSYFKEPLLEIMNKKYPEIAIRTALLGEEAALMGAASYWKHKGISLEN